MSLSNDEDLVASELAVFRGILESDYEGPSPLESFTVVPPPSGYHNPKSTQHTEVAQHSSGGPVDPPGIENWPRRLLQLTSPVWTSHEWQPGHIYGGHREPKYNAISYTWGRFRLDGVGAKSKTLRQVKGISIKGCPWNIPPIDPKRFTVQEFKKALERTAAIDGDSCNKFLWLDVACIDQETEAGQLEVGRQADIFKGAQQVSLWLTNFTLEKLEEAFSSLESSLQGKSALEDSLLSHVLPFGYNLTVFRADRGKRLMENGKCRGDAREH